MVEPEGSSLWHSSRACHEIREVLKAKEQKWED